jgi:hypothetical protein
MRLLRIALLICLVWLVLPPGSVALAQQPIGSLDRLEIDLWPDYDRESLLVLLTGVMPPGTSLPARVELPIPNDAELNAVARIPNESEMRDDIVYETNAGEGELQLLSFTTPDLRFRIEYYVPYQASNGDRSFDFTWQSAMAVDQLAVAIQQPASARTITADPPTDSVVQRGDGLNYHTYVDRPLAAGEPFTIQVDYTMTRPELTEALEQSPLLTTPGAVGQGSAAATQRPNWPLILAAIGGLALLAAAAWFVLMRRPAPAAYRRPARATNRPRPERRGGASQGTPKGGAARFCHNCGEPLTATDRFCRSCGTAVKGKT